MIATNYNTTVNQDMHGKSRSTEDRWIRRLLSFIVILVECHNAFVLVRNRHAFQIIQIPNSLRRCVISDKSQTLHLKISTADEQINPHALRFFQSLQCCIDDIQFSMTTSFHSNLHKSLSIISKSVSHTFSPSKFILTGVFLLDPLFVAVSSGSVRRGKAAIRPKCGN